MLQLLACIPWATASSTHQAVESKNCIETTNVLQDGVLPTGHGGECPTVKPHLAGRSIYSCTGSRGRSAGGGQSSGGGVLAWGTTVPAGAAIYVCLQSTGRMAG
jgi:hypothetical protein